MTRCYCLTGDVERLDSRMRGNDTKEFCERLCEFDYEELLCPTGLEPVACRLGIYRSIHLSYGHKIYEI